MTDPRDLLRAYLRQQAEMGEGELVLEQHTRAELRRLLSGRAAVAAALAGQAAPPTPATSAVSTERPASAPAARVAVDRPAPAVERAAPPAAPGPPAAVPPYPPGEGPMRQAPTAPARGVAAEEIVRLPTLDAVCDVALGCPRCKLAKTRTRVVFGEGDPAARVMVVGEAPGADEDRTGRPFVGKAGKLLDLLLMTAGFAREQVYICNVLKCRPPGNRDPQPDEVEACSPYLLRQVELVKPRVILAFGRFAAATLLGSPDISIGRMRGRVQQYHGVPLIPTYHPAGLLRNPSWAPLVWEDLQRARAILDPA